MEKILRWTVVGLVIVVLSSVLAADAVGADPFSAQQDTQKIGAIERANEQVQESATPLTTFTVSASLSGFVEFNYDYVDVSDTADKDSHGTSDLYLSSVELALRVFFNEWVKVKIVVNTEDLDRAGANENINLDEAIATLNIPRFPLYFTGGKTALPFGVFEDPLISGTLTEELYEIDDVGATLGFAPDFYALDISVTAYEGQNIIENLEAFGTHTFSSGRIKDEQVDSFIVNVNVEPLQDVLTLSVFYDSEPGDGKRNRSLGGALTLNIWELVVDAEYIKALEREKGDDGTENKENAWFVSLAFQLSDKLELATRYEVFDDDRSGDQDEILDYRYLAGFNYFFYDFATFTFEYRHSKFEKEDGSNAADSQNEFRVQLALAF